MSKYRWLTALTLVAGCGQPSLPTTPSVSPMALSITGDDLLLIGQRQVFTALSPVGATVSVRWRSDSPSVAIVDATTGSVTAMGTGTAVISADVSGRSRGTKSIRVIPDFGGPWVGSYDVTRCEATGHFREWGSCEYGIPEFLELALNQTREGIAGTLRVSGYSMWHEFKGGLTGSVDAKGVLSFTGDATYDDLVLRIESVRFETRPNGRLSGSFEQLWSSRDPRISGTVRYTCELTSANRLPQ